MLNYQRVFLGRKHPLARRVASCFEGFGLITLVKQCGLGHIVILPGLNRNRILFDNRHIKG